MEENDGLPLICRGESSLASPVDDDDGGECEDGLPLGSTKTGNIKDVTNSHFNAICPLISQVSRGIGAIRGGDKRANSVS